MRRDILFASLGVLAASFFMFTNYYTSSGTYRKFDISPLVYKHDILPIDTKKIYKKPVSSGEKITVYNPEYKVSVEMSNFQDEYNIETYMELPLETDGKTVKTDTLASFSPEEKPVENLSFIKYVKFQCISVRNLEEQQVHVGGFRFFQGNSNISTKMTMWNPHTGEREKYTGGSWSDSDQRTIIFCFSEPVLINRYELKSSDKLSDFDPVNWKIEGSITGTYWTVLDDRTDTETAFPKERNKSIIYIMNRL